MSNFENGNELYFAKVYPNAIIPTKRDEDAGYDIYARENEENGYYAIEPHTTKLIPTGIASALSPDYYIQIEERGSTGSKGIKKSAGVIDSGYRDEWFIAITNTNDKYLYIAPEKTIKTLKDFVGETSAYYYPMEKAIAQAVVLPVPKMDVKEISYDDLKAIESERGTTSLGASGK